MHKNKMISVVALVMAATLLTTTAVTKMIPPVYAQNCSECFEAMSLTQLQALAAELADLYDIPFDDTSSREPIIDTICDALEQGFLKPAQLSKALGNLNNLISKTVSQEIVKCVKDIAELSVPSGDCADCFENLSLSQLQALAAEIADSYDVEFPNTSSIDAIISTICDALEQGLITTTQLGKALGNLDNLIGQTVSDGIVKCMRKAI